MNESGVLFPLASLPGKHGIGDFGECSYKFLQYLHKKGYKYWQVLPLNPIGPGNSPYMSICSFALEDRYISLEELFKEGLLPKRVLPHRLLMGRINYNDAKNFKDKHLRKAYKAFSYKNHRDYERFIKQNDWLIPYALYVVYRQVNNFLSWNKWHEKYHNLHDIPKMYQSEVGFECFKQYVAYRQWSNVRKYAKKLGISIIADCPFYVGFDSVDCLLNKEQFLFDEKYNPTFVSGCPPDAFSEDGQLWGTPIYDFEKMKEDHFSFLIKRIEGYTKNCDILRLDHFRGFDTYCVIPAKDKNARNGMWQKGPGEAFFDELYKADPEIKLIAEDLGELFPSVLELKDHYNLPGMYVVQFMIFDEKLTSNPQQIVYSGTHDNQTLLGWIKSRNKEEMNYLVKRFGPKKYLYLAIMKYIQNLPAYIHIYPLQDLLKLGDRARINHPGTMNIFNWTYKLKDFSLLFRK